MTERIESLIVGSDAYRMLERDIVGSRISHAYLLISGDSEALNALSELFLKRAIAGFEESALSRAVEEKNCGDVIYLPLSGDKVTVADINHLTETAYITPLSLPVKYYVIDHGETMNEPSQNKLLKTLEEPPPCSRIIIKAASTEKLLPTVLSRCRKVELKPFTARALQQALRGECDDELLSAASSVCLGSLTSLRAMIKSNAYPQHYEIAKDILLKLDGSGYIAEYAAKLNDYKDKLTDIINFMETLLMSATRLACSAQGGEDEDLRRIASRYSPQAVIKESEVFARARKRIECNGNATAIVDELLFSLLEVRAKWK